MGAAEELDEALDPVDDFVPEDADLPAPAAPPPPPSRARAVSPRGTRDAAIADRERAAAARAQEREQLRRRLISESIAERHAGWSRPLRLRGRKVEITWAGKAGAERAKIAALTFDKRPVTDDELLAIWLDGAAYPLDKPLVARARAKMGKPVTGPELRAELRALTEESKGRPSIVEAEADAELRRWMAEAPARRAVLAHGCPSCVPALRTPTWDAAEAFRAARGLPPTCPRATAQEAPRGV